jgi:hypothetical protein
MNLIKQPNAWTCCATSYAMLMKREVHEVFNIAKHDGSEVMFTELQDPARRRGHSPWEFVEHALKCGFALTYIPVVMQLQHQVTPVHRSTGSKITTVSTERELWSRDKGMQTFVRYRKQFDLLLMGENRQGHCHHAAWCSKRKVVYDPVGRITSEPDFLTLGFWAKIPCATQKS